MSQTTMLRIAAFLVDALTVAILLVIPTAVMSYTVARIGGSVKGIQIVSYVALAVLIVVILIRDGYKGRSPGKQLLGLRIRTPAGDGCSWSRSLLRNLPLVIPLWGLVELFLVLRGKPRTGDRIAKTTVLEE